MPVQWMDSTTNPLHITMPLDSQIATKVTIVAFTAVHLLILKSIWKKAPEKAEVTENGQSSGAGPIVKKYRDKATLSKEVCAFIAKNAKEAIDARGVFHLAVAGGSLLDALAGLSDHKDIVDFSKVVLSFVNHKCVDPNSDKANMSKSKTKFAAMAGIRKLVVPSLSPTDGGDGSEEAELYSKAIRDEGIPHTKNGIPVLDLILLGLGTDGHIGSCHPMGPAVADSSKAVTASPKIGEPASITFTIETMNSARQVAVVASGGAKGKKEAIKRAMIRPAETPHGIFPAQLLESPIFFLDSEAGADI
jgi:6-phosphogluconolactonase